MNSNSDIAEIELSLLQTVQALVKGLLGTEQRSTKAAVDARPRSERIPGGVTGRQHGAGLGLETRQVLDVDSDTRYVVGARDRRRAVCIGVGDRTDEAVWPSWRAVRVCRQRPIRSAESTKAATDECRPHANSRLRFSTELAT